MTVIQFPAPVKLPALEIGNSSSATGPTISSLNSRLAFIGSLRRDAHVFPKLIRAVHVFIGTLTAHASNVVEFSRQGTKAGAQSSEPDGIAVQSVSVPRSSLTASAWNRIQFDTDLAVQEGERFAIGIRFTTFVSGSLGLSGYSMTDTTGRGSAISASSDGGVVYTEQLSTVNVIIEFSDGTLALMEDGLAIAPVPSFITWDTTATGDTAYSGGLERGVRFRVAETFRLRRVGMSFFRWITNPSASWKLTLYDDALNVIATETRTWQTFSLGGQYRHDFVRVPDDTILEAGRWYYFAVTPLLGALASWGFSTPSAEALALTFGTLEMESVSRTGGDWGASNPTSLHRVLLEIDGVDVEIAEPELPPVVYADGMNWDTIFAGFLAELAAIPELVAIYGDDIRMAGSAPHKVPLLEATLIADGESELWAPITVQVDLWNKSLTDVRTAENEIRKRYHSQVPIPIGGIPCWAQYSDGTLLAEPGRDGYFGRALRFRFTPLRAAYQGE